VNYIQRLFDAAAPSPPRAVAVPVAGAGMGSPIIAADQRLGMFPDLADPFTASVNETIVRAPERGGELAARERAMVRAVATAAERPAQGPSLPPESRAEAATPTDGGAPDVDIDQTAVRRISPLQRLAESAPLDPPVRRALESAQSVHRAAPADAARTETASTDAAPMPTPDPAFPAALSEKPAYSGTEAAPLAAPFRVTADQFQPYAPETRPPIQAVANDPAQLPPPLLQPRQDLPPTPPPLEPVARDAESPVARYAEALPPPPAQGRTPAPAIPERVVERIREVSVAPPAPPPSMTAADQSVIGSLSLRGSHGWQPRQEGF
jgi:hypothetical protein